MRRNVTVTVSAYTEQRVLLTATTFNDEVVLAKDISFDDLFDREDLRVTYVTFPTDVPDVIVGGMRREVGELQALKKLRYALNDERSSTCDSARYKTLLDPDGPLMVVERKMMVKAMIVKVMLKGLTGVWPHELRDMDVV